MGYQERTALFKQIEEKRQRPLISYITSIRPGLLSSMATDAIPYIIEQVNSIPADQDKIDFLIISNGGDPIVSLRIISMLRERFKHISVLVPYVAYSAATVLALGADEIIMHPYSNLGPVDPQVTISRRDTTGQQTMEFSAEDIRNYIEFVKNDAGITDQQHLISALNSLLTEIGPTHIGFTKRSQQLSLSLSTKMLETQMHDKNKAAAAAQALNSAFYHHGYAVARSEAKRIGLKVTYPDSELEQLMWAVWKDYSDELQCDKVFDLMSTVMADPTANQKLNSIQVVNLPANTPPAIAQQVWTSIVPKLNVEVQSPIEIHLKLACIENKKGAYYIGTTYRINYWRDEKMALSVNATSFSPGWQYEEANKDDEKSS